MPRSVRSGLLLPLAWALALFVSAPAPGRAQGMGAMDADTLQRILPAVVSITTTKIRPARNGLDQSASVRVRAFGSGFVIDPSGIIVTNRHVIEGAQSISVGFLDKSRLPAKLIAAARQIDVAVLKVDAGHPLPVLSWGDSDTLRIGEPVLAIGNPLGVGMSVSAGIVSALNRDIMDTPYDDYIQTDAAINHGNSGGPLVDKAGRVVGVDTAIISSEGNTGSVGVGFAIPAHTVQVVVRYLLDPEHAKPGWLGVRVQEVTPEIAEAAGLKRVAGALVTDVDAGSSAARAGIRSGDVVLRYGPWEVEDSRELLRLVAISRIGEDVPVLVWRNGHEVALSAKVAEPPPDLATPIRPAPATGNGGMMMSYGVHLGAISDADRRTYALSAVQHGALVTGVERDSFAEDNGIHAGDVIVRAGDHAVSGPADLRAALERIKSQGRRSALVLVQGKSGLRWVAVPLDWGR